MSMKNRRSNREAKETQANKPKVPVSTSPFASANSNPAKHHRKRKVAWPKLANRLVACRPARRQVITTPLM